METGAQGFANHQFKRPVGGFQIGAQVFHLFDALQQFAAGIFAQAFEALLAQFIEDVALAGKIAHQNALAVADRIPA